MGFLNELAPLLQGGIEKAKAAGNQLLQQSAKQYIEAGKATPEELQALADKGISIDAKPPAPTAFGPQVKFLSPEAQEDIKIKKLGLKKPVGEFIGPKTSEPLVSFTPKPGLPGIDIDVFVKDTVLPKSLDSVIRYVLPYEPFRGDPKDLDELLHEPGTTFPSIGLLELPTTKAEQEGRDATPFEREVSRAIGARRRDLHIGLLAPAPGAAKGQSSRKIVESIKGLGLIKKISEEAPKIINDVRNVISKVSGHQKDFLLKDINDVEKWLDLNKKVDEIKKTKGLSLEAIDAVDEESVKSAELLSNKIKIGRDEVAKMVEDTKMTPEDFSEFGNIYTRNPEAFKVSSEMEVAGQLMLEKNKKTVAEIKTKLLLEPDNVKLDNQFNDLLSERYQVLTGLQAFGSSSGRTLAFRRWRASPDKNFRKATEKTLRSLSREDGEKLLKEISIVGDDVNKQKKVIERFTKVGWKDKTVEYMINGMLSNIGTHMKNIGGNSLSLMSYISRTPFEVGFDVARSKLTGGERTVFLSEFGAMIKALKPAQKKATVQMKEDFTKILSGRGSEIPQIKSDEFQFLPKIGTQFDSSTMSRIGGKIIRVPTDVLKAEDRFFKTIVGDLVEARYAEKLKRGAGISKKKIVIEVDKKTKEILAQSDLSSGLAKLQSAINNNIFWKTRFPFFKTPLNLIKESFKHSPAGFLNLLYKGARGKVSSARAADDFAKAMIGTATAIPFFSFSLGTNDFGLPNITGPLPTNQTERKEWFDRGIQPFSIYINGKYRSYEALEPFSQPLSMIAAAGDTFRKRGEVNWNLALPMVSTIAQNITNKSSLKTLGDLQDGITGMIQEPEDIPEIITQGIVSDTTKLVPNIIQSIARGVDPIIRDPNISINSFPDVPKAIMRKLQSVLPGLSKTLPSKPGKEGLPIKRNKGVIGQLFNAFPASAPEINEHDAEFIKVDWSPPVISKIVTGKKGERIKLNPESFATYSFVVGQQRKRAYDLTINTELYQNSGNREKERLLGKATNLATEQAKTLFLDSFVRLQGASERDIERYVKSFAGVTDKETEKLIMNLVQKPLFEQSAADNRKNLEAYLFAHLKNDVMTQDVSTRELKKFITAYYDEVLEAVLNPEIELSDEVLGELSNFNE